MAEERILERIQKLLERANHPNTPEHERNSCLQFADNLMLKHAIEQAELDARLMPNERRRPVSRRIHLHDPSSMYKSHFRNIIYVMQKHGRIKVALHQNGDATIVGFNDDVNWTEMLWLHIFREFVAKIQPSWDTKQTLDFNVKALKEAGRKWIQIWEAIPGEKPCSAPPKDGGFLIRAYKRQCMREDVPADLKTQRHDAYRATFAETFAHTICARLEEMAHGREEVASKALVVSLEDVSEAFYAEFPGLRPQTDEELEAEMRAIRQDQRLAAERDAAWLAGLPAKEREVEMEKRAAKQRKEAADSATYWRRVYKEQAKYYDGDGARAGRRAAESVRLDRDATGVSDGAKGQLQ